jgi:mannitol-1-phosphate/altronate dehydrogenase
MANRGDIIRCKSTDQIGMIIDVFHNLTIEGKTESTVHVIWQGGRQTVHNLQDFEYRKLLIG